MSSCRATNANLGWARAERERDAAQTEANQLRLSHARLFEALTRRDCDYGCGCFKRHCPEGQPCLAHILDEVREELRVARITSPGGQSCEVLAARLDAAEVREELRATRRAIAGDLSLYDVARRQREACAQLAAEWAVDNDYRYGEDAMLFDAVEATPLVTEETP